MSQDLIGCGGLSLRPNNAEVFEGFWNLGFRNGSLAVGFGKRTRLQESSMGLARVGE